MSTAEVFILVVEVLAVLAVVGPCILMCISDCISRCRERRHETQERNAAQLAQRVAVEQARTLAARRLPVAAVAPAAPVARKKLGHFPYSAAVEAGSGASGERQLECAICLEAFVHGATCSEVPACRHLFHQECIEKSMRRKSTCPLCRADIVMGSEPEARSAPEEMV
jgi:hypothetical protein